MGPKRSAAFDALSAASGHWTPGAVLGVAGFHGRLNKMGVFF